MKNKPEVCENEFMNKCNWLHEKFYGNFVRTPTNTDGYFSFK